MAGTLDLYRWCGDYPGCGERELENANSGAVALFWAGCGGDQNPIPRRSMALAESYGRQLADGVEGVLRGTMRPIHGSFDSSYREIDLPFDRLPQREQLVKDSGSQNRYAAA